MSKSHRIQSVIPDSLRDRLLEHSRSTGITVSGIVFYAVMEYLDRKDEQKRIAHFLSQYNQEIAEHLSED